MTPPEPQRKSNRSLDFDADPAAIPADAAPLSSPSSSPVRTIGAGSFLNASQHRLARLSDRRLPTLTLSKDALLAADLAADVADIEARILADADADSDDAFGAMPTYKPTKLRKRVKHGSRRRPPRTETPAAAPVPQRARSATDHDAFAFDDDSESDNDDEKSSKTTSKQAKSAKTASKPSKSASKSTARPEKRRQTDETDETDRPSKRARTFPATSGRPRSALGQLQRRMGTNLVRYQLGRRGKRGLSQWHGGSSKAKNVSSSSSSSDRDAFSLLPDLLDMNSIAESVSYTDYERWNAPIQASESELLDALDALIGSKSFRDGQSRVISRVLDTQSTLLLSTTGGGKSLCYQLPTYLAKRHMTNQTNHVTNVRRPLTIVVSPLVALMEDQMANLPSLLDGAALHSLQTASDRALILDNLIQGKLDILFISPEKLTGPLFTRLIKEGKLPRVRLLCIDEIHCASEWSHNFRPAYLRLARCVREDVRPACVLGLSATVTRDCQNGLMELFGFDNEGVVRGSVVSGNIRFSVTQENDKYEKGKGIEGKKKKNVI